MSLKILSKKEIFVYRCGWGGDPTERGWWMLGSKTKALRI